MVDWTDMLKWPQNPKYYYIDKKYNFGHNALYKNFVRISEYKKYRCKELGACDSMMNNLKFPALIQLYITTIVDLLDMNNNCKMLHIHEENRYAMICLFWVRSSNIQYNYFSEVFQEDQ